MNTPCTCSHPGAPRATLVDGTVCCTWCPAWRHECEARHILNMQPLTARQEYLYGTPAMKFGRAVMEGGILQRRGEHAMRALQDTMTALWERRKAEAKAQVLGRRSIPANDNRGTTDEVRAA